MKVLLESTTFYPSPPPSYGGTEQVVWLLAEELNKLGHKVTVAAPKGSKFSQGIEHLETVTPQFGAMQEDQAWPIVLNRLVDMQTGQPKGEFDVVHCNSFRMWPYMAAKDHPSIKVCATIHWSMHWPMLAQIQQGQVPLLPQVPKPNFICLSNAHALHTSALLGVHVEYVHNGVDPEAYPLRKNKGDRYLFLGRIARFKGPHEAIALAEKHRFPLDVAGEDRFVGDPPYVHQVMNACRGMAKYWGEVSQEKKLDLLQNAKAVILPYVWPEPFGIVPLEANACGTPVIGIDYPGSAMREILKDGVNGFLCRTVEEMGEATKNVGDIKPEECRRWVEANFTSRLMGERYVKLYEWVLKEGGGW